MYGNISITVYIFITEHIASDMFYATEFTLLFCLRGFKHESSFTAKNHLIEENLWF